MLADIANGNTDFADVMFLVAFIVAVVGVAASLIPQAKGIVSTLLLATIALLSLGWLVL